MHDRSVILILDVSFPEDGGGEYGGYTGGIRRLHGGSLRKGGIITLAFSVRTGPHAPITHLQVLRIVHAFSQLSRV